MSNIFESRKFVNDLKNLFPETLKQPIKRLKKPLREYTKQINSYFDRTDVYIVSYPNSGRTWLRILLGKFLCEHFSIDESLMLDTRSLTKSAKILTTDFTHDCSLVDDDNYYYAHEMTFNKARYHGKKIILLIRDPRDVMVSYYFQQTKRDCKYQGTISDFIRDEKFGIMKLLKFNNIWYINRNFTENFLILSYEEMRANTSSSLRVILDYIGVREIEAELLKTAIDFASFSNMKNLEKQNYWENHARAQMVQARNLEDRESYKSRRGKIGGYVDYLSREDIEYINSAVLEETRFPCYKA